MELLGLGFLATFVEGLITYLFGKTAEDQPPRPWLKYVSLILGVLLALAYQIDIGTAVGLVSPFPVVGSVLSGLIIGRGANYLNDIMSFIKVSTNAKLN